MRVGGCWFCLDLHFVKDAFVKSICFVNCVNLVKFVNLATLVK